MAVKFQLILLASRISRYTLLFITAVVPYEIPSTAVLLIYLFVSFFFSNITEV